MRIFTVGRSSLQRLATCTPVARKKALLSTQRLFNTYPPCSSRAAPESQPDFYEQLKREERRQFGRKRIRFDYQANHTCALSLDYSEAQLSSKLHDEAALLSICEKYIIEHANRRVDLFFYTLIAYYQTSILPVEGHTSLQHGRGRNIKYNTFGTEACHSSFTPSLLDKTILENEGRQVKYKSLLSRTHLLQSLNATVELPHFVNAFDDILESICRPKCLVILREVSLAKITPIEGLVGLLCVMNTILQDFKQQASSAKYSCLTYPNLPGRRYVNPELIDLIIQGTLATSYDSESNKVNDLYVQSLLRMTSEEKELCKQNSKKKEKIYFEKIMAMQREIFESESQQNAYIA